MIEKLGHTAYVASDGKAAVAAVSREPFDLVLMDVQMPELDGLEATEAIAKPSGQRLPRASHPGTFRLWP